MIALRFSALVGVVSVAAVMCPHRVRGPHCILLKLANHGQGSVTYFAVRRETQAMTTSGITETHTAGAGRSAFWGPARGGRMQTSGASQPSTAPSEDSHVSSVRFDPLQNDIMDFAALLEGGLAQRLIDGLGQIKA